MNKETTRSLSLALLMIAAAFLPLLSAQIDTTELQENRDSAYAPPSPCLGADACRGYDSGVSPSDQIDLTEDFDWIDGPETNSYSGQIIASGYAYNTENGTDVYKIDMMPGYGVTMELSWYNGSSNSFMGSIGFLGEVTASWTSGSMYGYNSQTNGNPYAITFSSSAVPGCDMAYTYGACGENIDLMGEEISLGVSCYFCSSTLSNNSDYTMNITVFPADGGAAGDTENPMMNPLLSMPDEPFSWSYQTETFNLGGSDTALVEITSCDSWCSSESTLDITLPDGTVDSFGYWATGFTGVIANYSDAGEYTVEKMDSYGDGGYGLDVGIAIGNFSGLLTGDMFTLEDAASGHVNQTDNMDVYAVAVPENFYSNITVSWDADADLDVWLYSDAELTTPFAYSAGTSNPEFVDNGQTQGGQTFFVAVSYYSGSTASHAGYLIELAMEPGSPPPCWFQDDAWSGDDAGDASSEALNVDGVGVTTFSGMLCQGYDDVDYYEITVPAYHGLWASLDWGYENESIDGQLYFYQYMDLGYAATVSSSTGLWDMQAVATNESYSWTNDLASESTIWLAAMVSSLPEDYEMNYTISYSIYNATEEPVDSMYQNDGLFDDYMDAGDDYTTAMDLIPMNMTFEGYGHDSYDSYDYYKIYMPNNYAMQVTVSFPDHNDIDVSLMYQNPNWGWYSTISSSYNDNPEVVSANYDYADQDIYLRVQTDRGSGNYEVEILMWTPGLDPGSQQDDCGTGMDMDAPYYAGGTNGNDGSWANESTSAGLNPDDPTNHTGGVCEGWLDTGWDRYDVYHIPVPVGSYAMINVTVMTPGTYVYAYMIMCQVQHEDCGPTNLMYYAGPLCGYQTYEMEACESNSGLWPVGQRNINGQNGWITMMIYTYSANVTYEMDITFPDLSELEGGVQNDANSGQDAGPGMFTAVHVNDHMNATQTDMLTNNDTLEWEGWSMAALDSTDRYSFDVPANSGINIFLDCGYDIPDRWCILDVFDSADNQIAGSYYTSGYQEYNTTSQASNFDTTLMVNMRNWGTYDDEGTNYTFTVTFYNLDADGDGWWDGIENDCGTDPNDSNSTPSDFDGDGLCDALDDDIDNDGVPNGEDAMDFDNTSSDDMDNDGVSDQDDDDIDGDGWTNYEEQLCLGDYYNGTENPQAWEDVNIMPNDTDGDGLCDLIVGVSIWDNDPLGLVDSDSDNDGVNDLDAGGNMLDQFPLDDSEWDDTDGDRIGNNADLDDDGDGFNDTEEIDCLSDPLMSTSQPIDSDGDTICNALDDDNDNDGYNNSIDWDEFNPLEWMDSDGDGYGDNADMDDDNDGWWDSCEEVDWNDAIEIQIIYNFGANTTLPSNCPNQVDAFPYDSTEWIDTDGDLTGDNADTNDDGDAWSDLEELDCGTDPLDITNVPSDDDGDGICDVVDADDDGDGINDVDDAFPFDAAEQDDLDGDGIGDNADTDMDGDGWLNDDETGCLTDPMDAFDVPSDNDNDYWALGVQACDINDPDDDNDLVPDPIDPSNPIVGEDFFPLEPTESRDTDGDGIGDFADNDDDGDGWLDVTEELCANNGGRGDPLSASEMPADSDWNPGADGEHGTDDDFAQGDGICDALDPDTDGDGYPNPMNILAPEAWEDHFPTDNTEWYDANGDGLGDNGVQPTILDDVSAEPLPFIGVLVGIVALGIGLTRMANTGSKDEDIEGDYTDEFEDFDFDDEDLDDEESDDSDEDADEDDEMED
jgi:hypothetical protein